MKKEYIVIVLLLIWTAVMIVKPIMKTLPAEREYDALLTRLSEEHRVAEEQFNELETYCKEHEEALMKVSKVFLEQYHEDITPQETVEIAQKNTSSEWMDLSQTFSMSFSEWLVGDNAGEWIYYDYKSNGIGKYIVGVLYIDADTLDADEIDYYTNPARHTFLDEVCKVNDYLYVCMHELPYTH